MKLKDRLRQLGVSQREFARQVGVSDATVSSWISGRNIPDARKLPLIEAATAGAVKLADFLHGSSDGAVSKPQRRRPAKVKDDRTESAPRPGLSEVQQPLRERAAELGLDPEAIAAKALADAIRAEKARRWQEENAEAIAAWNAWTEQNELPLAKYRMF